MHVFNIFIGVATALVLCEAQAPSTTTTETVLATEYPHYKIVQYFVDKTMEKEAKVRDLSINHCQYYTHIYFAWKLTVPSLSLITFQNSPVGTKSLLGASMVFEQKDLASMYAPGKIADVLDFVLPCYQSVRPLLVQGTAYVATLRAYDQPNINSEIIYKTKEVFQNNFPKGAYILLWEDRGKMREQLLDWGFEEVVCGDSTATHNRCDWKNLGVPAEDANNQCIYRYIND